MSSDQKEFIYMIWAVLAVQGFLRDADNFLRQFKNEIYSVARKLSLSLPKELNVYRGLLLDDTQVQGDILKEHWPIEFLSFTEIPEVAYWFAKTDAYLGSLQMLQNRKLKGYVINHKAKPSEVLFYWKWYRVLKMDNYMPQIVKVIEQNKLPETDYRQFIHNIHTQHEVIIKPTTKLFDLTPIENLTTLSGSQLDKKFLPPWFKKDEDY